MLSLRHCNMNNSVQYESACVNKLTQNCSTLRILPITVVQQEDNLVNLGSDYRMGE